MALKKSIVCAVAGCLLPFLCTCGVQDSVQQENVSKASRESSDEAVVTAEQVKQASVDAEGLYAQQELPVVKRDIYYQESGIVKYDGIYPYKTVVNASEAYPEMNEESYRVSSRRLTQSEEPEIVKVDDEKNLYLGYDQKMTVYNLEKGYVTKEYPVELEPVQDAARILQTSDKYYYWCGTKDNIPVVDGDNLRICDMESGEDTVVYTLPSFSSEEGLYSLMGQDGTLYFSLTSDTNEQLLKDSSKKLYQYNPAKKQLTKLSENGARPVAYQGVSYLGYNEKYSCPNITSLDGQQKCLLDLAEGMSFEISASENLVVMKEMIKVSDYLDEAGSRNQYANEKMLSVSCGLKYFDGVETVPIAGADKYAQIYDVANDDRFVVWNQSEQARPKLYDKKLNKIVSLDSVPSGQKVFLTGRYLVYVDDFEKISWYGDSEFRFDVHLIDKDSLNP
ncbi:hypothetical protein [Candidatus Soleaferrea massiliensis]|uniref:hypothetical protein n=1 Tax=Candidatus Soleaferrea massiliensis TaxID=1470354 RepID=UPI000590F39B|nr:hypothetical protein [Candidatus Soleaferrea massiliensis]